ncbi:hypothetical protein HYW21_04155 [Candidatus Woesearchaeota archaeon]|nr:hypothetical protein [Candidatus Woesearchaeota archaeon]
MNSTKKNNGSFHAKKIAFIFLFLIMALVAMRINFSSLVGAKNQFFTLFQFFGPIAGSILGPFVGILTVLGAEVVDFFIVGKEATFINLIRLTPMLFAAYYFGSKSKKFATFIPIMAIAVWMLHPMGRQVWYFSLYWTIPLIIRLLPQKYAQNLGLKSLGATFTAHAVGGAVWIWSVPMTAEQWIGLIPVVAYERLLFALGIAGSYILVNTALDLAVTKFKWDLGHIVHVNQEYVLWHLLKIKA